ncbi:MAG: hypothetical protein AAGD32_01530 [Planctomycetota bacterium]
MYEEPDERSSEAAIDPKQRAAEKAEEFRIHAELAAVFEAPRKFDADVLPGADAVLKEVQQAIGKMHKGQDPKLGPLVTPTHVADAARLLAIPDTQSISTDDYHTRQGVGEMLIGRWLRGDEVDTFYERYQAHFDAALGHFREEERSAKEWKGDDDTLAYLDALDAIDGKLADQQLRPVVQEHKVHVLTTLTVGEFDILYLTDQLMGVDVDTLLGEGSELPAEPTEADRTWFMQLFSLRGIHREAEAMLLFAFLQKADEFDW